MDIDRAVLTGIGMGAQRFRYELATQPPTKVPRDRLEMFAIGIQGPPLEELRSVLMDVLKGEDVNEPFARFFAETAAIAQSARFLYDEPPLTYVELSEFVAPAKSFLNSFRHL